MRHFGLLSLALAGLLAFAPAGRAAEKPRQQETFKPAVLLRLEPLDQLIGDAKFLVKQTERDESAKQIEKLLKSLTGEKGLEGVDTKKPLGAYAVLGAKLDQTQVMILLPVSDEKAFVKFLKKMDFKVEKDDDGVHTVNVENVPFPILFRFAHGYAYATPKMAAKTTVPEADKLPKPDVVLGDKGGAASLTVNLDHVPEQIRKVAVSAAALQLDSLKEQQVKGESDTQKELRSSMLDELSTCVKLLIEDGGPVTLDLSVDQKHHDLSVSLKAAGKPDTALAKKLKAMGEAKGLAGLIGKDSAFGGFVNFSFPADTVKPLGAAVDEGFKTALDLLDDNGRKLVEPLVKALDKTAKSGSLDAAVDLRGPNKDGKYTVVVGLRVKDGDKIEEAVKKVIDGLPDEAKKPFKLDADKAEGVNVHTVQQCDVDADTKKLFGDGPLYFALSKDVLIVTIGDDALKAIKAGLATKPKAAGAAKLEVSLARLAPVLAKQRKNAVELAKETFKHKGSDKVTFSVEAGAALEVKLRIKTAVLAYAAKLDAEKEDAEENDEEPRSDEGK
jgi:hypothetical protein